MYTLGTLRVYWRFFALGILTVCLIILSFSSQVEKVIAAACIQDCQTSESQCYTDCLSDCSVSGQACSSCLQTCHQMAVNCYSHAIWCRNSDEGIGCATPGYCCSMFATLYDTYTLQDFPGYFLSCNQVIGSGTCIQCPPGTICPSDGNNPCDIANCVLSPDGTQIICD